MYLIRKILWGVMTSTENGGRAIISLNLDTCLVCNLLAFLVASLLGFHWPCEQLIGDAYILFTWKFFKLDIPKLVPLIYYYILALEKLPYFSKLHFLQVLTGKTWLILQEMLHIIHVRYSAYNIMINILEI